MDVGHVLPAINASLNATCGICLLIGYVHMKRGNIAMHRRFMISACIVASVFLVLYVTNHYLRHGIVTRFTATGIVRPLYFAILISHTTLAIVIVPLAIISVYNGLKMRVIQHRRIARWTFPLWMYVSITGVLVYFFLYQWFPPTS